MTNCLANSTDVWLTELGWLAKLQTEIHLFELSELLKDWLPYQPAKYLTIDLQSEDWLTGFFGVYLKQ